MKPYVYQLPLTKGWHAYNELKPQKGKTFKYFGYNWWDLMYSEIWKSSKYFGKGKYVLTPTSHSPGVLIINCGDKVKITNTKTKDVYNLKKYGYAPYNIRSGRSNENHLVANDKECIFNYVRVGDANYILVNVQDLLFSKSNITKTLLYENFMIACGIVNPDQYFATVGLNAFLMKISVNGSDIYNEDESMQEWVTLASDHWNYVNPNKKLSKLSKSNQIPANIHFIWLSKSPGSPNPLKYKFKKYIVSWRDRNPDCQIYLWTDSSDVGLWADLKSSVKIMYWPDIQKAVKSLPKRWQSPIFKLFKKHPNVGVRADTLRQVVLYTMGGIYGDVNDMACIMPLRGFREKFDFLCGMEPMMYVNNAFIAAKKKHIINKNFLEFITQNANNFINDWDPSLPTEEKDNLVVSETGPIAFSGILFGVLADNVEKLYNSCIFPCSWVYPNYEITEGPESWLKPMSCSAHFDQRDYLKKK